MKTDLHPKAVSRLRTTSGRGQLARMLAYLVLAIGIAFAIITEHQDTVALTHKTAQTLQRQTEHTAAQLALTTYNVSVRACLEGNKLRDQIRERSDVLNRVIANTDKLFVVVGDQIPSKSPAHAQLLAAAAQNARIIEQSRTAPDRNCAGAYAPLKPKTK